MGFGVTYEGLKPMMSFVKNPIIVSFGVTYEGLKPLRTRSNTSFDTSFWSYL